MGTIHLIFSFLFALYGAVILLTVSFRYSFLRGAMAFEMARFGPLGIFFFGLLVMASSVRSDLFVIPLSQSVLGLLLGVLFLFHFDPQKLIDGKKWMGFTPRSMIFFAFLLVPSVSFLVDLFFGKGPTLLFFFSLILLTGSLAFQRRKGYRLPFRFCFFFSIFFMLGYALFFFSWTLFIIDFIGGLSLLLSFFFAYKILSFFLAASFVAKKLENKS
ncbi:MAG: hypothetical protein OXB88_06885 [Bacteriovoracales bacterium]|nr:hypothetical protein [Bacteriovoracales bacterium]